MELAPDFDEFFGSLIAHDVEFLIVGAYALAYHGAPRFTGDIGVFIRPTADNAEHLLTALVAFGFPTGDLRPEDLSNPDSVLQMGIERVQIHVLSAIATMAETPRMPTIATTARENLSSTGDRLPNLAASRLRAANSSTTTIKGNPPSVASVNRAESTSAGRAGSMLGARGWAPGDDATTVVACMMSVARLHVV
ncbi:MAG TPA: hypothetical protein VGK32_17840 [Vicinamibacterales bacterium]|jgi:hypothetical protein